jgi:hypothetical protein
MPPVATQAPPQQASPEPQPPQLVQCELLPVATHLPSQQALPAPQACPQLPQCCASVAGLWQAAPQQS